MPSHNLAKAKIADFELLGYSVAGEESVIIVPALDVVFDIGKAPDQAVPINHVLLTHGHIDHSAGIAYYLSHRNFCTMPPGNLLAPEPLIRPIQAILDSWALLDGNPIPANLVPVTDGYVHQIKPNLFARAFATAHSKGSVGYCVFEKRKKLKEEYLHLTGSQIVKLKEKDVAIDYPVELPLISYFGDTELGSFAKQDFIRKSKLLITECTFFLDEHTTRAQAGRHMHVADLPRLLEGSENQNVLLMHATQRTGIGEIRRIIKSILPKDLCEKIYILDENNLATIS